MAANAGKTIARINRMLKRHRSDLGFLQDAIDLYGKEPVDYDDIVHRLLSLTENVVMMHDLIRDYLRENDRENHLASMPLLWQNFGNDDN